MHTFPWGAADVSFEQRRAKMVRSLTVESLGRDTLVVISDMPGRLEVAHITACGWVDHFIGEVYHDAAIDVSRHTALTPGGFTRVVAEYCERDPGFLASIAASIAGQPEDAAILRDARANARAVYGIAEPVPVPSCVHPDCHAFASLVVDHPASPNQGQTYCPMHAPSYTKMALLGS